MDGGARQISERRVLPNLNDLTLMNGEGDQHLWIYI